MYDHNKQAELNIPRTKVRNTMIKANTFKTKKYTVRYDSLIDIAFVFEAITNVLLPLNKICKHLFN